ncbi:hypothetical protein PRIPAC_86377 [Pristionchus pacificus]|uniref:Uncharacterized protein n=1 Tax=Pristionchus pacificus TaxID=54126 RepID=A0A2A6BSE6_PRIPA|nr:hypothetical protein PRIPAC_86377 [Pristionchus pacificus]|eukprot:PDM68820.1 hypothetical protein PRIPAC_47122 [Pristionchus pacificus]
MSSNDIPSSAKSLSKSSINFTMSTLRIFLSVLAIIKTAASTTCYSPVNLTVQHELLSKTIATSQLDCDKKCTETEECSSLVVDRKTDHIVCVFLGKQVPATVCIKPTEEYKKMECAEPDGRIVGCFAPAGLDTCRSQLTGPSRLASGGAGLADLDGPVVCTCRNAYSDEIALKK